jgi:REP element-mobilizing transposase RayT
MARKARVEVAGGLYHVITRGNNRQEIFHEAGDYQKFLSLLETQKSRLPFFLYAYCLMSNHVHLLIERQADAIGRIMHRLLTGYSQYYNRKYRKVGHLLQGRHKAILCQSETYLSELVRYIHLNQVRAKMLRRPEQYQYSSHRAYLGLQAAGIVDVDPVLRHFGSKKKLARERYREFVEAGLQLGHRAELYSTAEGRILGTEEFVDATIHRLGENERNAGRRRQEPSNELREFNAAALIVAVEKICGVASEEFRGPGKSSRAIEAKEALILIGRQVGASVRQLSEITAISNSAVCRRHDAGKSKIRKNRELNKLLERIESHYWEGGD